jgi:hypothetical protein
LRLAAPLLKVLGIAVMGQQAKAVDLPADTAEAMVHAYNGGGVRATGPAVLVRKRLADKVSLTGSLYVDMVSNASIDVVTTASPFKESRTEWSLGLDHAVKDTLMHVGITRSHEPDYQATTLNADVSQEVFGGMTSLSLGFGRGQDDVGRKGDTGYFDQAHHWQFRLGATQILSPRWLLSLNGETLADSGYLASPYRVARVFGSAVPERVPRTRHAQAVKLRVMGDIGNEGTHHTVRAEWRHYRDTWAVRADTLEAGYRRQWLPGLQNDTYVRLNRQGDALFYSDNASRETLYVSRNRQLSAFTSQSLGSKLTYALPGNAAQYQLALNGSLELVRFRYPHFTDLRSNQPYAFSGVVAQFYVTGQF